MNLRPGFSLLLAVLSACSPAPQAPVAASAKPAAAPRPVVLAPAGTVELPQTLDVPGVLAPQEELVLGFQVAGRLRTVAVDVGDAVQPQAVVAALDDAEFVLARDRAAAARRAARSKLGLAEEGDDGRLDVEQTSVVREAQAVLAEVKLKRERSLQLVGENLRSQQEHDAIEAALQVAESRVQAAREQARTWSFECQQRSVELQQSLKNLADSKLVSPWTGRVADRRAVAGQFVQAGAPVLTLLRTDPIRLRMQVPERLAAGVAVGQAVQFVVDGADSKARAGTIRRLGAAIDRVNRTLLVEAEVDNPGDVLRPGAFCRAQIVLQKGAAAVVVPKSAVVTFAGIDRVFEHADGKAKERQVRLGRDLGQQVEIVQGLGAGDVIVQDARGLTPNAPIAVKG